MLQLVVIMILSFVMLFGIGFILNMLIKTTWFPVILYLIVCVPLMLYSTWDKKESFAANLSGYTLVDAVPAITALAGVIVSGYAIRALRRGGYKMF